MIELARLGGRARLGPWPLLAFLAVAFVVPVATVLSLAVWDPARGWNAAPVLRIATPPLYPTGSARARCSPSPRCCTC